jgi:hypothetical protein
MEWENDMDVKCTPIAYEVARVYQIAWGLKGYEGYHDNL